MLAEKDFIEIEYTGILRKNDIVFDTTDEKLAKESGIYNPRMKYGPMIICIGEGHILKGLDKSLLGAEIGKEKSVELEATEAFGKKDPKLIMLVSASKFKKDNVRPFPGMQLNIDNQIATVRSVNGGRVMVDFNHPLAGQDVSYKIKVIRKVTDPKEKVQAELTMILNRSIPVTVEGTVAKVDLPLPEEIVKPIEEKITKIVPEIKSVEFKKPEKKPSVSEHPISE